MGTPDLPPSFTSYRRSDPTARKRAWTPLEPTLVLDTYWRFAAERQAIFFRRLNQEPVPWTSDSILTNHRFTNAYRAADRVSQYLIREVIFAGDESPAEVFFRILLFKIFNRIDTWELLQHELGHITARSYRFDDFDAVLTRAVERGRRIYSAAYIMPTGGPDSLHGRKHRMHLRLLESMLDNDLPRNLQRADSMGRAFEMLREYPTIGDFLAYQFVTDLNYGPLLNFSEMEFVTPGPGAKSGIHKCFANTAGLSDAEVISLVTDKQEEEFARLGLEFRDLWGRRLQLIDCQNLFCEVDKYSRVAHPEFSGSQGRSRIKQRFTPVFDPISYWFPPKWGINDRIKHGF